MEDIFSILLISLGFSTVLLVGVVMKNFLTKGRELKRAIMFIIIILSVNFSAMYYMDDKKKEYDKRIEIENSTKIDNVSLSELVKNEYLEVVQTKENNSNSFFINYINQENKSRSLKARLISPQKDTIIFETTLEIFTYFKKYGYETTNTIRKDENNIEYTLKKINRRLFE